MCTVSWLPREDGIELFSNRDEQRSRGPAQPPRVLEKAGVRYVSPIDADAGGTWIAANEYGLAFCLLNQWPARHRPERPLSRGRLILDLVDSRGPQEALSRFEGMSLESFPPFRLLVAPNRERPLLLEWDGQTKGMGCAEGGVLTSSSFEPASVAERRRNEYRRLLESEGLCTETLGTFHRSHANGPSAFSVCMHRSDARTVSHSRLEVGSDVVTFRYWPDAPCRDTATQTVAMRRRPA